MGNRSRPAVWMALILLIPLGLSAQSRATSPLEQFGFNLGDDYRLASFSQLEAYWTRLAAESDRMALDVIGRTAEDRPIYMAIITSPENHARLEDYREIARRLALAEGVSDIEARRLASEGKTVVWIDGGLHATETLGAQQLMELVYQMVSRTDEETLRFLDDVILLATCVNPDGLELVADWYMRESDPRERSLAGLPRLYQRYTGHDNNRDFYMSSQPETEAINRVLYREWFPQIVYNHHQSGPAGTVLFAPPFRDPFNYNYDPLIVTSLDLVAGAMHSRFLAEGKPGATMRTGANYSTWWNGGLRTSPYFHNMIGILTEMIGHPTPSTVPLILDLQLPRGDYPDPVEPGTWHFRQSIEYSMTANRAVLDFASRYRDTLLFNIWRMGMNAIERGSRDHWTATPGSIEAAREALGGETRERRSIAVLRRPENRDPRGYVLDSAQPDFQTAIKFVNALIKNGVAVERAREDFAIDGRVYSEGSLVVKTAQAFRPHVLDMFEPQDHPDDFRFPGAPPTPPYDTAGWTLAYQMGVAFDRILEPFDGPFERLEGLIPPPRGVVEGPVSPAGYLLSPDPNDAFIAVNRLLDEGERVYRLLEPGSLGGPGTFFVPAGVDTPDRLRRIAEETGNSITGISQEPEGAALALRPLRIGLWDRYGGSETSGWMRFILENFEFPFEVVYPPQLDAGDLASRFDVLIFPDGAVPENDDRSNGSARFDEDRIPPEYRDRLGRVTLERTVPELREFLESGGSILTIGDSTILARHLGLQISDALVDEETGEKLESERFYVPGSILRAEVDWRHPLAFGLPREVDVFFDNSPVFRLGPEADGADITPVARYVDEPLRSGWAWGEEHLAFGLAVVDARVGSGRLVLFGPEIAFRAQSHGTFKFLFNGIYAHHAEPVSLGSAD